MGIITLEEARDIREQFSPAFAGYVTDGDISDRDVLATLMDLIVKGYISIDAETQRQPVAVRKVYFIKNPETLLGFEREFIDKLFAESKELTARQVTERILSKDLHTVISNNLGELKHSKILKSLLLVLDSRNRRLDLSYKDSKTGKEVKVRSIGDLEKYRSKLVEGITAMSIAFSILLMGLLVGITFDFELTFVFILDLGLLIYCIVKLVELNGISKLLVFQFENNIVPFTKRKYEELFDFISAYPLKIQRLHNEFMPHSIAFGLDTSWNRSFYILTEPVFRSRARSHLSERTRLSLDYDSKEPSRNGAREPPKWQCNSCGALNSVKNRECWMCGSQHK